MPEVMAHLSKLEKGAGGEVQLTDSMAKLIGTQPFHGLRYEGKRFDCGDKAGFLEAQVAFALRRPDLAPACARSSRPMAEPRLPGGMPDPGRVGRLWPHAARSGLAGRRQARALLRRECRGRGRTLPRLRRRAERGHPGIRAADRRRARSLHGKPLRLWRSGRPLARDGHARRLRGEATFSCCGRAVAHTPVLASAPAGAGATRSAPMAGGGRCMPAWPSRRSAP